MDIFDLFKAAVLGYDIANYRYDNETKSVTLEGGTSGMVIDGISIEEVFSDGKVMLSGQDEPTTSIKEIYNG